MTRRLTAVQITSNRLGLWTVARARNLSGQILGERPLGFNLQHNGRFIVLMVDDKLAPCAAEERLQRLIIEMEPNILHRADFVFFAPTAFKTDRHGMPSDVEADRLLDAQELE